MANDFKNYAQMAIPFDNQALADEALNKFMDLVEKARNECKITDVHVIAKITISHNEGDGAAMSSAHFGNTFESEMMCAWAVGQESANRRTMMEKLMSGK